MIGTFLSKSGEVVFESYRVGDNDLAVFRIVYCLLLILVIGWPVLGWIPLHADFLFQPPKPLGWVINKIPDNIFFQLLSNGILLSLTGLLIGYKTRIAAISLSVLLLLAYAFYYSFGKIDHNILLVITPLILAKSGWGNIYSVDAIYRVKGEDVRKNTNALFNLALLIGFAFFTAGIAKLFGGWLELDNLAIRAQFYQNYVGRARTAYGAELLMGLKAEWIWKLLDIGVVFFEVGFLLAVVKRHFFQIFVILACFFHLLVMLFFNIAFLANLVVYFAFVKWPFTKGDLKHKLDEKMRSNPGCIAFLGGLILSFLIAWNTCFFIPNWSLISGDSTAPLQMLLAEYTGEPRLYLVLALNSYLAIQLIWQVLFRTTD